ncbi:PD-(D/E)XK nuclease family protein [Paraflavitalea sp. CAU 1676]|uniref:RecB family exonuclease n=1 Tax=Paraflavitalea sp. CAU 1676 TaxID=3032598 RepID=UPI0023DA9727|nr:PD-(D/E)XK nuclease family protein [Paraflavitalea sp. CAU 1676]MDF2190699.1 PD-(D/E)XK nuclease family protein [Paraflavitalea sp. CAU 1676]
MHHPLLPVSDLERIGLFVHLIDRFPVGHPLKRFRGDVYFEIVNFHQLFKVMMQEGWQTEILQEEIEAYLAGLDTTALPAAIGWTEKLTAALHEFDNYRLLLVDTNRYEPVRREPVLKIAGSFTQQPTHIVSQQSPGIQSLPPTASMPLAVLEDPFIQQVIVLLNYIVAEQEIPSSGEAMLFELLHGPWFQIAPNDILDLTLDVADRQYTEHITTLRRLLYEKVHSPAKNLFAPGAPAGMKKASDAIEKLIPLVGQLPVPDVVSLLLEETGITEHIDQHADNATLAPRLNAFHNWITEESLRHAPNNLGRLLKLIALAPYLSWADSLPVPTDPDGRIVALGRLYKTADDTDTKPADESAAPIYPLPHPRGPVLSSPYRAIENKLVQRFAMHATALNSYLRCPLEFYYNILVRTPFPRNEATEFGSAVHFALEMLFKKMQSNQEAFPAKQAFILDFESYMHRRRASFTQEQFDRRLGYGREVLENYYEQYAHRWNTIVTVERNFRNVVVRGVPIKGKIDKLEFDGRSVNLVDYKTGDPDKADYRLSPPRAASPLGGDYWRQAVFYKILVDNYQQKEWKVTSAEFDFIEPDRLGVYHKEKLFIGPEDVETVTQQFTVAWERIRDRDFYTGCGKPGCHWCRFVKSYGLDTSSHP